MIRLQLSSIVPGTERVTLIPNGDFEEPGPLVDGRYPFPTSWSHVGSIFVASGTNVTSANGSWVASACSTNNEPSSHTYYQNLVLEPNTEYVLSAYI